MKILPVAVLFLSGFFIGLTSIAQNLIVQNASTPESIMLDTAIELDPGFKIRDLYSVKDSITAYRNWASKMRDTSVVMDPSFTIRNVYSVKDSIAALYGGYPSRRDSLIHAIHDSLSAIGNALLHTADMQDTLIARDPLFKIHEVYANKNRADASRDSLRALLILAASMQDTIMLADPAFVISERYAGKDRYDVFRDSVWAELAAAAKMQDTVIRIEPSFIIAKRYQAKDRLEAYNDSIAWPTLMHDTVIAKDPSFPVKDVYPLKDYRDSAMMALNAYADSVYSDSVNKHWAGWKNFEVEPDYLYTLYSQRVLKGHSKAELQYNVADFYLYLNGEPVKPENSDNNYFPAGCLAFEYNDTLLLNSGLGFKLGIGVGIKIIQGKFSGSLHANKHNQEIYKDKEEDTVYKKSIEIEPNTQSLKLQYEPTYHSKEIITGEYQASFRNFYEKNEEGLDEVRHYTIRIVFRCRVTGGLDSLKSPG